MAIGDKLIKLEGLAAVRQKLSDDIEALKQRVDSQAVKLLHKPDIITQTVQIGVDAFGRYTINESAKDWMNPITAAVYVDPVNGNNNNPGTADEPYLTCDAALANTAANTIYLMPGRYNQVTGLMSDTRTDRTITRSLNIIGIGEVYMTNAVQSLGVFGAYSETTGYRIVSDATANRVIDTSLIRQDGGYAEYEKGTTSSVAKGQYASATGTNLRIWVNPSDGRSLEGKTMEECGIVALYTRENQLKIQDAGTVYIENVHFQFGGVAPQSTSSGKMRLACRNCSFDQSSASTGNGFAARSVDVILENCTACYNSGDGFSYHTNTGVPAGVALEINCAASYNGQAADTSDNGSTAHNGTEIVRVNCEYDHNYGGNIADTGNTKSWCVGCYAHDSLASTVDGDGFLNNADFWLKSTGVMYCCDCRTGGGTVNNLWAAGATMYCDSVDHETEFTDTYNNVQGVIAEYTQQDSDSVERNHTTLLGNMLDKLLEAGTITQAEYDEYVTLL